MVKKWVKVWREVCDFCDEEKKHVCELCGKDVCDKHALRLEMQYVNPPKAGYIAFSGETVVSIFCPNHLTEELQMLLTKKIAKIVGGT